MLSPVRTTVTLDEDTEQIVRARMRSKHVSFKQALNDAIRDGAPAPAGRAPFVMDPRPLGKPKVDLTKALQLAAELEDEHTIEVMRRVAE
jgi:hypothetical protein